MKRTQTLSILVALTAILALPAYASSRSGGNEQESDDDHTSTVHNEHDDLDNDLNETHGMRVERNADGHMELHDTSGNRYSYRLANRGSTGETCPAGKTVCYHDSGDGSGNLVVNYSTGKSETAHAEAHNGNELTEHANRMGYNIVSTSNGLVTVRHAAAGSTAKVRYGARLNQGTSGYAPGIRVETDGRIIVRYNHGLEQDIIVAP